MPDLPSKESLKRDLVRLLAADLETLERAQQAAIEGATHEEAKPENDKDTRALEASYLARGQAMRLEELRAGLKMDRKTLADSLVRLKADKKIKSKGAKRATTYSV